MLAFPYFERVADNLCILDNGEKYDRLLATRGKDYLLIYNHTGRKMTIDLSRISGKEKQLWWFNPESGEISYIGRKADGVVKIDSPAAKGEDYVLIATDADARYLSPSSKTLPLHHSSAPSKDLEE